MVWNDIFLKGYYNLFINAILYKDVVSNLKYNFVQYNKDI